MLAPVSKSYMNWKVPSEFRFAPHNAFRNLSSLLCERKNFISACNKEQSSALKPKAGFEM